MTTLSIPTKQTRQLAAQTRNLTKTYGQGKTAVRALDGVDVDLPSGQFTAVMGPSGSGKSTLMHCLAASTPWTPGWPASVTPTSAR